MTRSGTPVHDRDVPKVGLFYMPPYGNFGLYLQQYGGEYHAYPQNGLAPIDEVSFTFTNGRDFQRLKIYQTGLIERDQISGDPLSDE